MNTVYGQHWIGRSVFIELTCLNFFFWGHIKSLVYDNSVTSAKDLVRIARLSDSGHVLHMRGASYLMSTDSCAASLNLLSLAVVGFSSFTCKPLINFCFLLSLLVFSFPVILTALHDSALIRRYCTLICIRNQFI